MLKRIQFFNIYLFIQLFIYSVIYLFLFTGEGNISIGAEFNFHSDAEAAHVVLNELQCPVMLICWETVMKTGVPFVSVVITRGIYIHVFS